jgi:hypothetical protein
MAKKSKQLVVGIIGSAGRNEDAAKVSRAKWEDMLSTTESILIEIAGEYKVDPKSFRLVSGAAALSDHCAIQLYIEGFVSDLTLHLPAKFVNGKFEETKDGKVSNYHHFEFGEKVWGGKFFSLNQIGAALKYCESTVSDGFIARDKKVAEQADVLIALTFGAKNVLKKGGTAITTKHFLGLKGKGKSYHVDLSTMEVWTPCKVK